MVLHPRPSSSCQTRNPNKFMKDFLCGFFIIAIMVVIVIFFIKKDEKTDESPTDLIEYYSGVLASAEEALQVNAINRLEQQETDSEYREKSQPELDGYIRKYCLDTHQVFTAITSHMMDTGINDISLLDLLGDIITKQDGYARKYGSQQLLVDITMTYIKDEITQLETINK